MGLIISGGGGGTTGPTSPGWKTGNYYYPQALSLGTKTLAQNQLHFIPLLVPKTATFDRICVNISSTVASSSTRLGIYAEDGSGQPGTLVLDAGAIATATTGSKEITISQQLTAAWYFLCCVEQGVATGPTMFTPNNPNNIYPTIIGSNGTGNTNLWGYQSTASTFSAALPGTAPALSFGTPPLMWIRKA